MGGGGRGSLKGTFNPRKAGSSSKKAVTLCKSLGTKAQQGNQANQGELEPFTKGGALGLMDSLIFEFPEVYG